MLVRQGHPGPGVRSYQSYDDKRRDAIAHKHDDGVPWTVLVDTADGRVHRQYGMLSSPTFLIDRDGRIAFYSAVTHAPTLHHAIDELLDMGGLGVALAGFDRRLPALPIVTGGWPAIRRGLPQSAIELELATPGTALLPFAGHHLPRRMRSAAANVEPWSARTRWLLGAAAASILIGAISWRASRALR